MTRRKAKVIFVRPKKFYRVRELEGVLKLSRNVLIQNAMLCGALYRVQNRNLINLETMRVFLEKVGDLSKAGGKYCQVCDAAEYLGVSEEQVMQIASDAGALFRVRSVLLIDKTKLDKNMEDFRFEVRYFDVDEFVERERIKRRLDKYV